MTSSALNALSFIISTIFDIFALLVAVRFMMQATRADYYNPIAQAVVKITDPLLRPLRKVIPGFKGLDMASIVLCFLVLFVKLIVVGKLMGLSAAVAGYLISLGGAGIATIVGISFVDVVNLFFNVLIYSIVILALLSWIVPDPRNPLYSLLQSLTNPILRHIRGLIPPLGGLDLSALVAIIGLYALKMFVIGTLIQLLYPR